MDFVVEYCSVIEENESRIINSKLYFIKNDMFDSELDLKYSEYYRPQKNYIITDDDIVYQMVITEDKLEVYKSIPQKMYDSTFRPSPNIIYHNNSQIIHEEDENKVATTYDPISRDRVFLNCYEHVQEIFWTWQNENGDISQTGNPSYVKQPDIFLGVQEGDEFDCIPLMSEFIENGKYKKDGDKQDCERRGF